MRRPQWLFMIGVLSLSACFDALVGDECAPGFLPCDDDCLPPGMCPLGDGGSDSQETGAVADTLDGIEVEVHLSGGDAKDASVDSGGDVPTQGMDAGVDTPVVIPDAALPKVTDAALDIPVDSLPLPDAPSVPDSAPDLSVSPIPDLALQIDTSPDSAPDTAPDTASDTATDSAPDTTVDTTPDGGSVDSADAMLVDIVDVPPDTAAPDAPVDVTPDTPIEDAPQLLDGPCVDCSETGDALVFKSSSLMIRWLV